jgi:hypothetical protein
MKIGKILSLLIAGALLAGFAPKTRDGPTGFVRIPSRESSSSRAIQLAT